VATPLLATSSSSTVSLATLSKQERRQQFEAQVKAHDELLQQQQAAAVAEQQHQQQQQQLPDTSFYPDESTAIAYQDPAALGYADSALGLPYQVDPGPSQLYPSDAGLIPQDVVFYGEQPVYQCKLWFIIGSYLIQLYLGLVARSSDKYNRRLAGSFELLPVVPGMVCFSSTLP